MTRTTLQESALAGCDLPPAIEAAPPAAAVEGASTRLLVCYGASVLALAALPVWRVLELRQSLDLGMATAIIIAGAAWHLWRCVPPIGERRALPRALACGALMLTTWQLAWVGAQDFWFVRASLVLTAIAWTALWSNAVRGWRVVVALSLWALWLGSGSAPGVAFLESWTTEATAKAAGWLLWQGGENLSVDGALIHTSAGSVLVGMPCTGLPLASLLLVLLAIAGLVLRIRGWLIAALGLVVALGSFLIGIGRVALLTLAVNDRALFDYWHGPSGNAWFSALGMVLLAWLVLREGIIPASRAPATPIPFVPGILRHIAWPLGGIAAAVFCWGGAYIRPADQLDIPAPQWPGVHVVGDNRQQVGVSEKSYDLFSSFREVTYSVPEKDGRLRVAFATIPLMLSADPRLQPNAPKWVRDTPSWTLQPGAGGSQVLALTRPHCKVWLAAVTPDGRSVLDQNEWEGYYRSAFRDVARWAAWLRHQRPLMDKNAAWLALAWESPRWVGADADEILARAHSAWREHVRSSSAKARIR